MSAAILVPMGKALLSLIWPILEAVKETLPPPFPLIISFVQGGLAFLISRLLGVEPESILPKT